MDLPLPDFSKIKINTMTNVVHRAFIAEVVISVHNDPNTHFDMYAWVERVARVIALLYAVAWVCFPGSSYTHNLYTLFTDRRPALIICTVRKNLIGNCNTTVQLLICSLG
jgi:hypothetical protein